jgi:hypothetical protein
MVMDFKDVSAATGLKALNEYLACRSYISGPEPSQNDLILFRVISLDLCKDKELVNVKRWYMHIKSFSGDEMKSFPHAKEHIKITHPEGSEKSEEKQSSASVFLFYFSIELKEPPTFINERLVLWDKLKAERETWLAAQPRDPITITLPDGKEVAGNSWSTTPYEVASSISKGLADNCVVAKVDNEEWDLDRPFEKSCSLKLIKFDDDDGKKSILAFFCSYSWRSNGTSLCWSFMLWTTYRRRLLL